MDDIYQDEQYYNRALDLYNKVSNRFALWFEWMDSFFENKVINVLEENVPRSVECLRMFGIGCGSGDIDHDLVVRLLTRYSKISNTVLEPSDVISEYKSLVQSKPLPHVKWHWLQQTFEAYYRSNFETLEKQKFHFISAIAVLFYFPNWKAEVMNMYNLLESGGVLMIAFTPEESGFWRVWQKFPMLADHLLVRINTNDVKTFLQSENIAFEVVKQTSFVDITCCSKDGDGEGSMLIDFISHVKDFKTRATPQLQADFMQYICSTECSRKDNDRILFNNSVEAIIVRKS